MQSGWRFETIRKNSAVYSIYFTSPPTHGWSFLSDILGQTLSFGFRHPIDKTLADMVSLDNIEFFCKCKKVQFMVIFRTFTVLSLDTIALRFASVQIPIRPISNF